jgi:hypothetical protein
MTYFGTIKGGVVILRGAPPLPNGTEVTVAPVENGTGQTGYGSKSSASSKMLELGRAAESKPCDLPSDLAANHDHYLHGLPKRR